MLQIVRSTMLNVPLDVEVDEYIPLAVRTYSEPIGAAIHCVGNSTTSLVEIAIDQFHGTIRGFKVVSIDRLGPRLVADGLPESEGVPIVAKECVPERIREEVREFSVCLHGDDFHVNWSDGQPPDSTIRFDRLTFYLNRNLLIGVSIADLTGIQVSNLLEHLAGIA